MLLFCEKKVKCWSQSLVCVHVQLLLFRCVSFCREFLEKLNSSDDTVDDAALDREIAQVQVCRFVILKCSNRSRQLFTVDLSPPFQLAFYLYYFCIMSFHLQKERENHECMQLSQLASQPFSCNRNFKGSGHPASTLLLLLVICVVQLDPRQRAKHLPKNIENIQIVSSFGFIMWSVTQFSLQMKSRLWRKDKMYTQSHLCANRPSLQAHTAFISAVTWSWSCCHMVVPHSSGHTPRSLKVQTCFAISVCFIISLYWLCFLNTSCMWAKISFKVELVNRCGQSLLPCVEQF